MKAGRRQDAQNCKGMSWRCRKSHCCVGNKRDFSKDSDFGTMSVDSGTEMDSFPEEGNGDFADLLKRPRPLAKNVDSPFVSVTSKKIEEITHDHQNAKQKSAASLKEVNKS
jgi:hypothetical protein